MDYLETSCFAGVAVKGWEGTETGCIAGGTVQVKNHKIQWGENWYELSSQCNPPNLTERIQWRAQK